MSAHDDGHTIAGWAGALVATAGALAIGAGIIGWRPGLWLGLAALVASVLLTWSLHLAGWGKPPGVRPHDQRAVRTRDRSAHDGHDKCLACRLAGRGRQVRHGHSRDRQSV
ncbi:HGxxPAAW family protein [Streptomyces sp. NPDC058257]|uniref:HGxxPAAW family protein n=1 Tax=Streptomyces sp. NPDC058257 TaxID=3346409 RepID=UPI0036E8BB7B